MGKPSYSPLIQAVVVRQQKPAADAFEGVSQSHMVVPVEPYRVHILGGKIRRIGIEECVDAVIMFNERLEVLILYNDISPCGLAVHGSI